MLKCKNARWPQWNTTRSGSPFQRVNETTVGGRLTAKALCFWIDLFGEDPFKKYKNHLCSHVFKVLFSPSITPAHSNRLFNKASLLFATRMSLWVTTQEGSGPAAPSLMKGPDIYCKSARVIYSHWNNRGERRLWGSGRRTQDLLASLGWSLGLTEEQLLQLWT